MDSPLTSNVFSFLDTRSQWRMLCASAGAADCKQRCTGSRSAPWCAGSSWAKDGAMFQEIFFHSEEDFMDISWRMVMHDLQVMKSQCLFFIKLCTVLMELGSYMKIHRPMDFFNRVDSRQTSLFHPFPVALVSAGFDSKTHPCFRPFKATPQEPR